MISIRQDNIQIKSGQIAFDQYTTVSSREVSFLQNNWPKESVLPASLMGSAGFFYEGNEDEVTCFSCGIGLCDWSKNDNPFMEHAIFNSDCPYIRINRSRVWTEEENSLNVINILVTDFSLI